MKTIEEKKIVERLFISRCGGTFDNGNDKVWDTWQIEGPDMVWYFCGVPHIHGYFHRAVQGMGRGGVMETGNGKDGRWMGKGG